MVPSDVGADGAAWQQERAANMPRWRFFRSHGARLLVDDEVREVLAQSEEYAGILERLEVLALLGDRLHALTSAQETLGAAADFSRELRAFGEPGRPVDALLNGFESWLKAMVQLAFPAVMAKWQQDKPRHNLYDALGALGLLSPEELETPLGRGDRVTCPARRAILDAKELRNIKLHEQRARKPKEQRALHTGIVITVLATLFRHEQVLREATRGVLLPPEDGARERELCEAIELERRDHVAAFRGRVDWLARLDEVARCGGDDDEPRLVAVYGKQGQGKTALLSKWMDQRAVAHPPVLAETTWEQLGEARWLPGAVVHFGKEAGDPRTIARVLLWQANALLLSRTPTPSGEYRVTEGASSPAATAYERRVAQLDDAEQATVEQVRNALGSALAQLVAERGRSMVIIDAVDEILRKDPDGLEGLPNTWPRGMTVVFTTRPGDALDALHARWPRIDALELPPMDALDLAAVVERPADDAIVTRLCEQTEGWALAVRDLQRQISEGRSLDSLEASARDQALRSMTSRWEPDLEDLLLMLALLEPIAALGLEDLKAWWSHVRGETLRGPALRRLLKPVREQLGATWGSDARLRLSLSALGEHVRRREFLESDLREGFEALLCWLATRLPEDDELAVHPMGYWAREWKLRVADSPGLQAMFEALFRGASQDPGSKTRLRQRVWLRDHHRELWKEGLEHAASLRALTARRVLGMRLLDGRDFPADPVRGEELLRGAADEGDVEARISLGTRLLDGDGVPVDHARGLEWLRAVARTSNAVAQRILGVRLLLAPGSHAAHAEAIGLLRAAAEAGDVAAMNVLGRRLLDGEGVDADPTEGARLLNAAATRRDVVAMRELGVRLLEGRGLAIDADRGEELLRRSAEAGDPDAMWELGVRLRDGDGLERSLAEGVQWLDRAELMLRTARPKTAPDAPGADREPE
jgi:TPR repeat protein